jgi:hypothetical protein
MTLNATSAASFVDAKGESSARRVRVDQLPGRIVLRFCSDGSAWELVVPDEVVELAEVRVALREFSTRRRAEASVLMPWKDFVKAREWLRCLPDGHLFLNDTEPALTALKTAFGPLIGALSA